MIGAGVDISKDQLYLAVHPQPEVRVVSNDGHGIKSLMELVEANHTDLIVIEATGGYERPLLEALWDRGIAVALVNPRQTRDFAKAIGKLAKTDKVDAKVLARFAATLNPRPTLRPSEADSELRALSRARTRLVQQRVALLNYLDKACSEPVREVHESVVEAINKAIVKLENAIQRVIAQCPVLLAKQND